MSGPGLWQGADVLKDGESSGIAAGRAVYDDGVLRITEMHDPPGLAFAGEIDEGSYRALVGTLRERARGSGEIHFNLGGVEYCDLAGLRAIILVAGTGAGGRDRRLVLHAVPRQLQTVLQIVGWDATPGVVID
jgi:ABC-type transporter Mla MlaB component